MELAAQAPSLVDARAGGPGRRGRAAGSESRRVQMASRVETESAPESTVTWRELVELWDRHGGSAYALACALLGNEVAAAEAVRLAMADLARSIREVSIEEARRSLVRQVYRHAQERVCETPGAGLPPIMVWLSQLARLQRASLALCVFGRLTHREVAALLDVPPSTVADLLTATLRELGGLTDGATATCA